MVDHILEIKFKKKILVFIFRKEFWNGHSVKNIASKNKQFAFQFNWLKTIFFEPTKFQVQECARNY